jgi:hypothetical protein
MIRVHCKRQVICWDRGRPARNEREARNISWLLQTTLRPAVRLRAGRPQSQPIT